MSTAQGQPKEGAARDPGSMELSRDLLKALQPLAKLACVIDSRVSQDRQNRRDGKRIGPNAEQYASQAP